MSRIIHFPTRRVEFRPYRPDGRLRTLYAVAVVKGQVESDLIDVGLDRDTAEFLASDIACELHLPVVERGWRFA